MDKRKEALVNLLKSLLQALLDEENGSEDAEQGETETADNKKKSITPDWSIPLKDLTEDSDAEQNRNSGRRTEGKP